MQLGPPPKNPAPSLGAIMAANAAQQPSPFKAPPQVLLDSGWQPKPKNKGHTPISEAIDALLRAGFEMQEDGSLIGPNQAGEGPMFQSSQALQVDHVLQVYQDALNTGLDPKQFHEM